MLPEALPLPAECIIRPRVRSLDPAPDFERCLRQVAHLPGLCVLDSCGPLGPEAQFSWIAFAPRWSAEGLTDPKLALGSAFRLRVEGQVPGPFCGGFMGALAYDLGPDSGPLGPHGLVLPPSALAWPPILGGLYTDFLVFDRLQQRVWSVLDGSDPKRHAELEAELQRSLSKAPPKISPLRARGPLTRQVRSAVHQARIETLRAWIAAGELYQANLAHRMTLDVEGEALALFLELRSKNPAAYMGFLSLSFGSLLSASPELLLRFEPHSSRGPGQLSTQPIKGTSARHLDPVRDRAAIQTLLTNPKERAELAMIVDLARNDVGVIARPGSVRVGPFPELLSLARVHHLCARVEGECGPEVDAVAAFCALFPGASISGAPKLAALAAIAELEGEGRGHFSGSMGYVDARGRSCFNILIRSLCHTRSGGEKGQLEFWVGGGITFGSDAAAEDRETLHKARATCDALGIAWADPESGA